MWLLFVASLMLMLLLLELVLPMENEFLDSVDALLLCWIMGEFLLGNPVFPSELLLEPDIEFVLDIGL